MKMGVVAVLVLAGCAGSASAQGLVRTQVSPALAETWSDHLDAAPGQSIDIRCVISYNGTAAPLGLSSARFQPTISNWDGEGTVTDRLSPFADGLPWPLLWEPPDPPGNYGRVSPFGRTSLPSTSALRGHAHVVDGVSYLRIAQSQATAWFGGAGNTSGGSGVPIEQNNLNNRPSGDIPFEDRTVDLVVFKINIVLSEEILARTMLVETPVVGFGNRTTGGGPGQIRWFSNTTEVTGSTAGPVTATGATINVVPAPSVILLVGLGLGMSSLRWRYA